MFRSLFLEMVANERKPMRDKVKRGKGLTTATVRRPPKMVPGKIRFAWAKTRDDGPDWFATWALPAEKGDCNLILTELPKLANELVRRGYDPSSIRFECAKLISPDAGIRQQENH